MLLGSLKFPQGREADGRTLFFPVSLVFVDHRSSLVIGHGGNLQVSVRSRLSIFGSPPRLTSTTPRLSLPSPFKILWTLWLNPSTNPRHQLLKNSNFNTTIQLPLTSPSRMSSPSHRGSARHESTFTPRATQNRGSARCACSFDETFDKRA